MEDEDDDMAVNDGRPAITDKEFYKAMQKLKERGTNAVPPKKSASAYIIFGKEVKHLNLKPPPTYRNELKFWKEIQWQKSRRSSRRLHKAGRNWERRIDKSTRNKRREVRNLNKEGMPFYWERLSLITYYSYSYHAELT